MNIVWTRICSLTDYPPIINLYSWEWTSCPKYIKYIKNLFCETIERYPTLLLKIFHLVLSPSSRQLSKYLFKYQFFCLLILLLRLLLSFVHNSSESVLDNSPCLLLVDGAWWMLLERTIFFCLRMFFFFFAVVYTLVS